MSTGPHADVDRLRGQLGDQRDRPDRQIEGATGRFAVLERGVDLRTWAVHDERSRRGLERPDRVYRMDEESQANICGPVLILLGIVRENWVRYDELLRRNAARTGPHPRPRGRRVRTSTGGSMTAPAEVSFGGGRIAAPQVSAVQAHAERTLLVVRRRSEGPQFAGHQATLAGSHRRLVRGQDGSRSRDGGAPHVWRPRGDRRNRGRPRTDRPWTGPRGSAPDPASRASCQGRSPSGRPRRMSSPTAIVLPSRRGAA